MELKKGSVLLFKGTSIFSKLIYLANYITYYEKGYSHAAIIGEINAWSVIVYEALSDGFVKNEYGKTELLNLIKEGKVTIGFPNTKLNRVKSNCEKYLGRGYGWIDIFHIGLYTIFGTSKFLYNSNAKKLICSEAVARILYDASNKIINLENEFNKKYDLITPMDLFKSNKISWSDLNE